MLEMIPLCSISAVRCRSMACRRPVRAAIAESVHARDSMRELAVQSTFTRINTNPRPGAARSVSRPLKALNDSVTTPSVRTGGETLLRSIQHKPIRQLRSRSHPLCKSRGGRTQPAQSPQRPCHFNMSGRVGHGAPSSSHQDAQATGKHATAMSGLGLVEMP